MSGIPSSLVSSGSGKNDMVNSLILLSTSLRYGDKSNSLPSIIYWPSCSGKLASNTNGASLRAIMLTVTSEISETNNSSVFNSLA